MKNLMTWFDKFWDVFVGQTSKKSKKLFFSGIRLGLVACLLIIIDLFAAIACFIYMVLYNKQPGQVDVEWLIVLHRVVGWMFVGLLAGMSFYFLRSVREVVKSEQ